MNTQQGFDLHQINSVGGLNPDSPKPLPFWIEEARQNIANSLLRLLKQS